MKNFAVVAFLVAFGVGCGSGSPMSEVEAAIDELCNCKGDSECTKKAGKRFATATKKMKEAKLSPEDAAKFGQIMGRALTCQRDAAKNATKGARDAVKKASDAAKKYYE